MTESEMEDGSCLATQKTSQNPECNFAETLMHPHGKADNASRTHILTHATVVLGTIS